MDMAILSNHKHAMSPTETLDKILHNRRKNRISIRNFTPSAVLVPVFEKNSEDHLLFTQRNQKVQHHKGEICFPGGVYDKKDHFLLNTALRECEEEIGLKPEDVLILGELDDLMTPTYFRINPFVARIPYPYPFKINETEIDSVLEIPLRHFMDEKNLELKTVSIEGEEVEIPFYHWENHQIWGATGRIVRQLINLLHDGGKSGRR